MTTQFDAALSEYQAALKQHAEQLTQLRDACPHTKVGSFTKKHVVFEHQVPYDEYRVCLTCGLEELIRHQKAEGGKLNARDIIEELSPERTFPRKKYITFPPINEVQLLAIRMRFAPPQPPTATF